MEKIIRMLFITLVLTSCAVKKNNQTDISPELQNKMGVMYAKGLGKVRISRSFLPKLTR